MDVKAASSLGSPSSRSSFVDEGMPRSRKGVASLSLVNSPKKAATKKSV